MPDISIVLLGLFGVVWCIEHLAFGMQRVTLLLSRQHQFPPQVGAMLLPDWFPVVWLVRLAKWGLLIAIAVSWHWGVAIGLLLVGFVLTSFLPIPYSLYISSFKRRIAYIKVIDHQTGTTLEAMLDNSNLAEWSGDS